MQIAYNFQTTATLQNNQSDSKISELELYNATKNILNSVLEAALSSEKY